MKLKKLVSGFICFTGLFAVPALASISVNNVSVDKRVDYPSESTFNIEFGLFGSEIFVPPSAVGLYLTQDDGKSVISLGSAAAKINCGKSGLGTTLCKPQSGTRKFTADVNMLSAQNKNVLGHTCTPLEFKVLAKYSISSSLSSGVVKIGPSNPVDWLVSSGSLVPNKVSVGDKMKLKVTVSTGCSQTSGSAPKLALYMTDKNYNGLYYYGQFAGQLPNQASYTFTVPVPQLADGTYYMVMIVDPDGIVDELNEKNNAVGFKFTVSSSTSLSKEKATASEVVNLEDNASFSENFVEPQLPVTPALKVIDPDALETESLTEQE
ncbi:hypothetical protein VA7868_03035 [Vibrio aerogenes CECT 7868]|uniref:CARDB domain-containing protein n=1 Tax=Vibrio aerogenes CECT 7868 TaxID=1216006 RepID=A0A1M5ZQ66_9VIBR|nr:CARDB domain-containing protein [Vibrio aerogenes]SHI26246.1 hypothetical protein VA7868_03035 [Vibrio aerogenes CECT 7868]